MNPYNFVVMIASFPSAISGSQPQECTLLGLYVVGNLKSHSIAFPKRLYHCTLRVMWAARCYSFPCYVPLSYQGLKWLKKKVCSWKSYSGHKRPYCKQTLDAVLKELTEKDAHLLHMAKKLKPWQEHHLRHWRNFMAWWTHYLLIRSKKMGYTSWCDRKFKLSLLNTIPLHSFERSVACTASNLKGRFLKALSDKISDVAVHFPYQSFALQVLNMWWDWSPFAYQLEGNKAKKR